jgi:hypothetical protein
MIHFFVHLEYHAATFFRVTTLGLVDVAVIMKGTVLTTYEGFKNFG